MSTILNFKTLSEFLNSEFTKRKHKNESYSLRAYARDLSLSASRLSDVLKGEQGISEKTADVIAAKLKLKTREKNYFKDLILAESARNEKVREAALQRLEVARKLSRSTPLKEDQFHVIADWYHSAIYELTQVTDFKADPKWIAQRLGIDEEEATMALTRLQSLGLIKKAGGKFVTQADAYEAIIDQPSAAIRKFQRQVISMSIDSLLQDPGDEREILSMLFAIPKSALPEFRQEMRNFMHKIWQKVEDTERDELYSFSMQLCPVKNRRKTVRAYK